jgi:hypothetical protein
MCTNVSTVTLITWAGMAVFLSMVTMFILAGMIFVTQSPEWGGGGRPTVGQITLRGQFGFC